MKNNNTFKPAWWLKNKHLQTIYARYMGRRRVIESRKEIFELPDGDFLDCRWVGGDAGPIVLSLHGLEGSVESHYAKGMLMAAQDHGWRAVLVHFRSCGGEINRLARGYHSGDTNDLNEYVKYLQFKEPNTPIIGVGYSMGGNVLLKWLGETAHSNPLVSAIAVSVPFELHKAAEKIGSGVGGRFYQNTDEKTAAKAQKKLEKAAGSTLEVLKIDKKQRKRNPTAPFITSTLQQEAARKLGFTTQRTMRTAQQLYEGIDVGHGVEGLITYMRTDSINLTPEAIQDIRALIESRYGKENMPDSQRVFKGKSKNAQEAHKATPPINASPVPEEAKSHLTPDQFKLYSLIWKREIDSQMMQATSNTVGAELGAGAKNVYRATGSTIANPGFITVYQEGTDDEKKSDDDEKILPEMEEGQKIKLKGIESKQHFTEPPPAFTEASLVKSLEEHGIGRPSTYATIIYTLKQREYVEMDKKRFKPTDVGIVVTRFLTEYFKDYVDYDFTAKLEDHLDAVARGEEKWVPLLKDFWAPFKKLVDHTEENVKRSDVTQEKMDEKCPKCDKELTLRLGRRGRFVGCSGYPECDYTRSADGEEEEEPEVLDRNCDDCGEKLMVRHGRYGKFIGCTGYPKCKHIEQQEKPKHTNVRCPECSQGNLGSRKSRH